MISQVKTECLVITDNTVLIKDAVDCFIEFDILRPNENSIFSIEWSINCYDPMGNIVYLEILETSFLFQFTTESAENIDKGMNQDYRDLRRIISLTIIDISTSLKNLHKLLEIEVNIDRLTLAIFSKIADYF
jgi:hypothetical protein